MTDPNPELQFQEIWSSALTKYKETTQRGSFEVWLEADSPDALFRFLDDELQSCKHYQTNRTRVRNAIQPVLELVITSSRTIGENLVTAFPPAQSISIAIRVLLRAAKDVSANYNMIIGMFEELRDPIGCLDVGVQQEITEHLKRFIVGVLAQLLVVLGMATKRRKQNWFNRHDKVIGGKDTQLAAAIGKLKMVSKQEVPQPLLSKAPDLNSRLPFEEIWGGAVTTYNQHTEGYHLIEGGLGADSPDALFGILDSELNKFKEYRKNSKNIRDAIRPFLELVNISSEAIAEGIAGVVPPAKAVSVAIRVLLKAANDVSVKYDLIIEMFEELKGFTGRLDVHNQEEITKPLQKIIVKTLSQLLVVLGVATKWTKQNRASKYWRELFWKDTEVSDAMQKLRTLSKEEFSMVAAVTLVTAMQTSRNVQALGDSALRNQIRSWLKPPDPTTNYNTALEARTDGTGTWFTESQDFVDWMTKPGSFLWIHGIPGNGKTIICSTVIETLKHRVDSSVALAYFYFNFNDPEKLIHRNMLHSLVFQLCQQHPDSLIDLYKRTDDGSWQPTEGELLDVLKKSAGSFSQAYIVLDGLDECVGSERTKVLKFLAKVKSWDLEPLHVLAASRPEQEIKEQMDTLPGARHVDLHDAMSRNNEDIQVYLDSVLKDDTHLKKWGAMEKTLIRDTLVKRADGMFQWVRCQLESLQRCVTHKDLETALGSLPKTLDETYERILRNIPDEHQENFHVILQFLCFSERPMMLGELAEVVTVATDSEGKAHYDYENRMRDSSDVLTICGSLVSMSAGLGAADVRRFQLWRPVFPHDTMAARFIRLSHFSVKEYLLSKRIQIGRALDYSVNAKLANRSIAMTCLVYLMRFDTDGLNENRIKTEKDVSLVLYAARHWVDHFQQQGPDTPQPLQELVQEFFHPSRRAYFLNWIRMYDLDRSGDSPKWHREANTIPDPLYYSCSAGFLDISKWLLTEGANVNAQGGDHGSALQAASIRGHESIVQLLLDRGADSIAQGGRYGNALRAASAHGYKYIVQLLLDRGADINATGRLGLNALQAASFGGHESIVKLLLDRGANTNGKERLNENVLQVASFSGHESIQLQLDRQIDMLQQGGHYVNALEAAAARNHVSIVRLLLDGGADANAQGRFNGTALQVASYRGHEAIVRLLLDRGANTDAQERLDGNALQLASSGGHETIVQLLLDRGANIKLHGNALHAASAFGRESIVRLLLDRGAEINVQAGSYANALEAASQGGHETIARLLLDRGAEINAQGRWGNALQVASHNGREAVVRLLLDRGAEINAQGGEFGNALLAASRGGYEAIMRLLLERGAELNAQGGEYGSVLQAALIPRVYRRVRPRVVAILWDAGARLYTMPSEAHSEEYIHRLPPDMDSMTLRRDMKTPEPHSSRRRSWS